MIAKDKASILVNVQSDPVITVPNALPTLFFFPGGSTEDGDKIKFVQIIYTNYLRRVSVQKFGKEF